MYVKVHFGNGVEETTECKKYRVRPFIHNDKEYVRVVLFHDLENLERRSEFELLREAPNAVYVMNNDGRTIDSYYWS